MVDKSQELLKIETIRSQCLVLISSLIEVFGDTATRAVLLIVERLLKKSEQTQILVKKEEETKTAPVKNSDDSEDDQESLREAQEF